MSGPFPPMAGSALYYGRVMHKRLRPFQHRFDYRVVSFWLDIDALPHLSRQLRLFAHNGPGLFAFLDRDHGPRTGAPLRPWVEAALARRGIDLAGGPIHLLCFPRLLGYVFNPLSIYFCRHRDGRLMAILYEVRNTFGDMHGYLLPVGADHAPGAPIRQRCDKRFYVSPFIGMDSEYRFRLEEPGERLSVLIRQAVPEGELLIATLSGRRAPLTDGELARAFASHPLMTLKVIGAIHWQALRLWRKGATFHRRVPAPATEIGPEPEPGTPHLDPR